MRHLLIVTAALVLASCSSSDRRDRADKDECECPGGGTGVPERGVDGVLLSCDCEGERGLLERAGDYLTGRDRARAEAERQRQIQYEKMEEARQLAEVRRREEAERRRRLEEERAAVAAEMARLDEKLEEARAQLEAAETDAERADKRQRVEALRQRHKATKKMIELRRKAPGGFGTGGSGNKPSADQKCDPGDPLCGI
jgi:hypothetical protein